MTEWENCGYQFSIYILRQKKARFRIELACLTKTHISKTMLILYLFGMTFKFSLVPYEMSLLNDGSNSIRKWS